MSFHVYTLCYNESKLLPHFLYHYREAERIVIYDNHSTDNSIDIIESYRVQSGQDIQIRFFDSGGAFDDVIHMQLKNEMWKESIGHTDYVLVQDLDEFLYFTTFPTLKTGLAQLKSLGVQFVKLVGYNMFCDAKAFESIPTNTSIINCITTGIPSTNYSKPNLFDPNQIHSINFEVGNHTAHPVPSFPPHMDDTILLLHYGHVGLEDEYRHRLDKKQRHLKGSSPQYGFSTEYGESDERIYQELQDAYQNVTDLRPILFPRKVSGHVAELGHGLGGGIGNQFFTIAATMAYAYEHGFDYVFKNKSSIPNQLNYNCISFDTINDATTISEVEQQMVSDFWVSSGSNVELAGYFQSSIYFKKYKYYVCKKMQELINRPLLPRSPKVGIHVRRGDYIRMGWDLPLSYYHEAIKQFDPTTEFVIVTDDPEWCKEYFPSILVHSGDALDDFQLLRSMSSCIISNSTFSWWAVYLGEMDRVIAPMPWFKNDCYNTDIYEETWERIELLN